jgi:hypothetical protein
MSNLVVIGLLLGWSPIIRAARPVGQAIINIEKEKIFSAADHFVVDGQGSPP